MQIEEVNDATLAAEAEKQETKGYTFITVPSLPNVFPNFKEKATLEKF